MQHLPIILFGVLAALSLGSAIGVVLCGQVVHAAVCLVLAALGVAGILGFLLEAPLVAAALTLMYGTLAVLVYLLAVREGDGAVRPAGLGGVAALPGTIVCLAVAAALVHQLLDLSGFEPLLAREGENVPAVGDSAAAAIGHSMVDGYLLSSGLLGIMLLVGTLALAHAGRRDEPPEEG